MPLEALFGNIKDVMLNVVVVIGRGDCLSCIGIMRDLGAIFGRTVNDRAKFDNGGTAKIAS